MACYIHLAQKAACGMAAQNRADHLIAGCFRFGMGNFGDDFQRLLARADNCAAQLKMRAFMQRHLNVHTAIIIIRRQQMQRHLCAGFQRDLQMRHRHAANRHGLDNLARFGCASGHDNLLRPLRHFAPNSFQRL